MKGKSTPEKEASPKLLNNEAVIADGRLYFSVCTKFEQNETSGVYLHFRCTRCDTIEALPYNANFSVPENYEISSVNFLIKGTCKKCR